jgi:hypothetical protein
VASLEETASFEGIETFEDSALVRLLEAVDRLLASQSKEKMLPTSTRDKSTFLVMAIPPISYRRIITQGKAEVVLRI